MDGDENFERSALTASAVAPPAEAAFSAMAALAARQAGHMGTSVFVLPLDVGRGVLDSTIAQRFLLEGDNVGRECLGSRAAPVGVNRTTPHVGGN